MSGGEPFASIQQSATILMGHYQGLVRPIDRIAPLIIWTPVGSVVHLVQYGLLHDHESTVNLESVIIEGDAAEVILGEALLVQVHGT